MDTHVGVGAAASKPRCIDLSNGAIPQVEAGARHAFARPGEAQCAVRDVHRHAAVAARAHERAAEVVLDLEADTEQRAVDPREPSSGHALQNSGASKCCGLPASQERILARLDEGAHEPRLTRRWCKRTGENPRIDDPLGGGRRHIGADAAKDEAATLTMVRAKLCVHSVHKGGGLTEIGRSRRQQQRW